MKRGLLVWFTIIATIGMMAVVALAANPHFVSGPTITSGTNTVTACGKIAGLGNNKQVTIVVEATATTTCQNRGGNTPPGLTETLVGRETITSDKNGNVTFCVTTSKATNPCPDQMKPTTSFTNFTVKVYDAQGNQIL
jgi:hypothetical protein